MSEFLSSSIDTFPAPQKARLTPSVAMLFRPSFLARVESGTHIPLIAQIGRATGLVAHAQESVLSYLSRVYGEMREAYRCEYVYKNELLNYLVTSRHTPGSSLVIPELRLSKVRVDLAVVNGTTCAYEIKTAFDSLGRLEVQIDTYLKVFDRVYVVCDAKHLAAVQATLDARAGILTLDTPGEIVTVREHLDNVPNVSAENIFSCMRKPEFLPEIERLFGGIPQVPNTLLYRECRSLFATLAPEIAHASLIRVLKLRYRNVVQRDCSALPSAVRGIFLNLITEQARGRLTRARFETALESRCA